jgi:glycerol kinase
MEKYILALDQGTTSSRAIIFGKNGAVIAEAISKIGLDEKSIAAIGITNQRETTVIWDRESGKPVYNAIVWQDRRTSEFCSELKSKGYEEKIRSKTGLVIDAYFSATKIRWILDNVKGARLKAEQGKLAFGTIDSWLVWNLTRREKHITDITNASRTMLFNIHSIEWDEELLALFDIPKSILPEVKSSSEIYAETDADCFSAKIPIAGLAGDQQSALLGQMCTQPGMLKNTYGTGAFLVLNTGAKPINSNHNLLTTIAWKLDEKITYALEGSIFIAGAVVQWLRDELKIVRSAQEIEELATTVDDNGGVYMVPAFSGLGAPHWDQFARGTIFGLTRGTHKGHIARAALESIAFQTMDVMKVMESDSGIKVNELRVDGGATTNNLLMQIQSDVLGIPIIRSKVSETTALGAAFLAGLAVGYWGGLEDISVFWEIDKKYTPRNNPEKINEMNYYWNRAVNASKNWLAPYD